MDPVPHWPAVIGFWLWLGMWTRIQKKRNWPNKLDFQHFKMDFVPIEVCFMTRFPQKVYFSWENLTFCDGKVSPGSGSGSAWIRIGFAALIRFCIEIKSLIRIMQWTQCGSRTLVLVIKPLVGGTVGMEPQLNSKRGLFCDRCFFFCVSVDEI